MSLATKFQEQFFQEMMGDYCMVCKEKFHMNTNSIGFDCLCTKKPHVAQTQKEILPKDRKKILKDEFDLLLAKKYFLSKGKSVTRIDKSLKIDYEVVKNDSKEFCYLNIPKLQYLASSYKYKSTLEQYIEKKTLFLQDWMRNKLFDKTKKFFSNIKIEALPIHKVKVIHEDFIGKLAFFEDLEFYSKNIGIKIKDASSYSSINYIDEEGWNLELYINQDYFTTNKVFMEFKIKEINRLNGLFRITNVDYEKNTIYGAPIYMGN